MQAVLTDLNVNHVVFRKQDARRMHQLQGATPSL
jgi:hypothetical protein